MANSIAADSQPTIGDCHKQIFAAISKNTLHFGFWVLHFGISDFALWL